jgi:FlaA1/EpsC-like NDP-sugar epimerase
MVNIYKISFQIYRAILILILPLFLFAKFMVGLAGHNPENKISDYVLIGFAILTAILLTILNKNYQSKSRLVNTLRITIISLVFVSIIFLFYGLYDFTIQYLNHNFDFEDNIPVAILLVLISLSMTLLIGLIKNKV